MTYKLQQFVFSLCGCLLFTLWEVYIYSHASMEVIPAPPTMSYIAPGTSLAQLQDKGGGVQDPLSSISSTANGYLIYTCRLRQKCCGFVDRIRGIAHAFVVAAITRRKFGIHMELPTCELSSILHVNQFDWRVNITSLEASNLTSQVYSIFESNKSEQTPDFKAHFDKDVVYYTSNELHFGSSQRARLRWLKGKSTFEIIGDIFNKLFRLTPSLQQQVDDVVGRVRGGAVAGSLVSAQIRLGRSPSLQVPLSQHARLVWTFLTSHLSSPGARLFVASDSQDVIAEARSIFGERLLEVSTGPILHVAHEKNKSQVCAGLRRLMVDMHVLAASHVLLLTPSGVGDMAAHLHPDSKAKIYCYRAKQNTITQLSRTAICR